MLKRLTLAFLAFGCCAQQLQVNGRLTTLNVLVSGEDGTILAGASVSLYRVLGGSTARLRRVVQSALADSQGNASFANVDLGLYRLCARTPSPSWIDPCDWGLPLTTTSVSSANSTARVPLTLKKGVTMSVQIDDPLGILGAAGTPATGLLLGVVGGGFHTLPPLAGSQGLNYQIVIPFDVTVDITITSSRLQISSAAGLPLQTGTTAHIPFMVATGSQPSTLRFLVKGSLP